MVDPFYRPSAWSSWPDGECSRGRTRDCPPGATTWSLFCALHDASIAVAGRYEHRAVALQEVRFAIEDATRGIELAHRMMDYNNLEPELSGESLAFRLCSSAVVPIFGADADLEAVARLSLPRHSDRDLGRLPLGAPVRSRGASR